MLFFTKFILFSKGCCVFVIFAVKSSFLKGYYVESHYEREIHETSWVEEGLKGIQFS